MFNEDDIKKTYSLLAHEEQTEVRLIDPTRKKPPKSVFVNTEEEFLKTCIKNNGKYNIYAGINERKPEGTKATDVISVKTTVIDIDAKRKNSSQAATKEELEHARNTSKRILEHLTEEEFKTSGIMMSGNGYQIWLTFPKIEVTDENRKEMNARGQRFQKFFQQFSDRYTEIDNIGDLPRIIKVAGTMSIKGTPTETRPHRRAVWEYCERQEDPKLREKILGLKIEQTPSPEEPKFEEEDTLLSQYDIQLLFQDDQKMRDLYYGNYNQYNYSSRSEAEIALVMKLIAIGMTKPQVFQLMKNCGIGKWNEKGFNYKNITFTKANLNLMKSGEEKPDKEDPNFNEFLNKDPKRGIVGVLKKKIAEHIINHYKIITPTDTDEVMVYTETKGIYEEGEKKVRQMVVNLIGSHASNHVHSEVIMFVKNLTYQEPDEIFSPNTIITLINGNYDIEKNELLEHTSDIYTTSRLPIKYDSDADCPLIKKFVSEIVEEDNTELIREIIGYCLWREYHFQKAFMLIGEGENGKSVLINVIKAFLGKDNFTSISLQDIAEDRFARADLKGKLANLYPDLDKKSLKTTGVFKMLTGGDSISADKKFKSRVHFQNYAKLIFSANELPRTEDTTMAFFRRWIIIRFPNTFPKERRDPNLTKKLTTHEELSGLFNWVVEGLKSLLEREEFIITKSTDETKKEYQRRASSTDAFANECLEFDPRNHITKDKMYEIYGDWCCEHKLSIEEQRHLTSAVQKSIYQARQTQKRIDGRAERVWIGVRFRKGIMNEDEEFEDGKLEVEESEMQ